MTSITVREKEHWKERISRKIEQAIEAVYAKERPTFAEEVDQEARRQAAESLGLVELRQELEQLNETLTAIENQRTSLYRKMLASVLGQSVEEITQRIYSEPMEVRQAIQRRAAMYRHSILGKTEIGRQVLELEREKEELLDTVWLATSGTQIKLLWQKVAEILQQQPTPLQQEAIVIPAETTE